MSRQLRFSICAYNTTRGVCKSPQAGLPRVKQAMDLVRQAKYQGAQLAALPEICALIGVEETMNFAEPLDGNCFSLVSDTAKELNIYIAFNHPSLVDDNKYNSTVLFNSDGKIEGVYNKTYPTIWEMEAGCVPGKGAVVLDTDIGRIGFATCYDLNFTELRTAYRNMNPDLILFPSYFRGGLQCRWWAFETISYLASSVIDPGSVIVNPIGRVIKKIDCINNIMTQTIELDYKVLHYDYNNFKIDELREKYGSVIDIDSAEAEGVFLLSSKGDTTIDKIIDDIELEEVNSYFNRAIEIRNNAFKGKFPNKGPAAWPK